MIISYIAGHKTVAGEIQHWMDTCYKVEWENTVGIIPIYKYATLINEGACDNMEVLI